MAIESCPCPMNLPNQSRRRGGRWGAEATVLSWRTTCLGVWQVCRAVSEPEPERLSRYENNYTSRDLGWQDPPIFPLYAFDRRSGIPVSQEHSAIRSYGLQAERLVAPYALQVFLTLGAKQRRVDQYGNSDKKLHTKAAYKPKILVGVIDAGHEGVLAVRTISPLERTGLPFGKSGLLPCKGGGGWWRTKTAKCLGRSLTFTRWP